MKNSTSREKLSQIHEQLDRELECAGLPPRAKSRRDREEFRFVSELNENKKSSMSTISTKPIVYEEQVRDVEIKSKKSEIGDLERKLMELEKKMDNFSISSGKSEDNSEESQIANEKLNFRQTIQTKHNQDTARFLVNAEEKIRNQAKFTVDYQDNEEEEDSEDYFEIQQAIQKRKIEHKLNNQRKISEKDTLRIGRESREKRQSYGQVDETKRKAGGQTQSVLRPKYSAEKSERSNKGHQKSLSKRSVRESGVSKKSVEKSNLLQRSNSRGSLMSRQSVKRDNQKSRERMNRSMDRSEGGEKVTRDEEVEVARELKRVNNLQHELQHYKRLAKKYKNELEDYKVMEIEFRELKKNFAKSELIRNQQKKIIDGLKAKINR